MPPEASGSPAVFSIVVPCYNEADGIDLFHRRLSDVMMQISRTWEVIYVNDGSRDLTLVKLEKLHSADECVSILNLSRNFGKEIALTAGLDHARGDAIIIIDADLQDPPEVIPMLVDAWREGYDMVYAQRRHREGESWLKKSTARAFYRLVRNLGERVTIPEDTGDFRLMSRRAKDAVLLVREHHRFMKGLFAWVGFPAKAVLYDRQPRHAGATSWSYWRLWNFAVEGITGFTVAPLKLATYLGLTVAFGAAIYGLQIIVRTLVFGNPVAGYPSLMIVVLLLGGIQLITLGLIGEYLGRMFNETKRRPLYLLERYEPSASLRNKVPVVTANTAKSPGRCAL